MSNTIESVNAYGSKSLNSASIGFSRTANNVALSDAARTFLSDLQSGKIPDPDQN